MFQLHFMFTSFIFFKNRKTKRDRKVGLREEGRKEGRKERRNEGRKEGRKEVVQ